MNKPDWNTLCLLAGIPFLLLQNLEMFVLAYPSQQADKTTANCIQETGQTDTPFYRGCLSVRLVQSDFVKEARSS